MLTDEQAKGLCLFDIPKTYPDGTGNLTPHQWVEWAKAQLLYGEQPLPKQLTNEKNTTANPDDSKPAR